MPNIEKRIFCRHYGVPRVDYSCLKLCLKLSPSSVSQHLSSLNHFMQPFYVVVVLYGGCML